MMEQPIIMTAFKNGGIFGTLSSANHGTVWETSE